MLGFEPALGRFGRFYKSISRKSLTQKIVAGVYWGSNPLPVASEHFRPTQWAIKNILSIPGLEPATCGFGTLLSHARGHLK